MAKGAPTMPRVRRRPDGHLGLGIRARVRLQVSLRPLDGRGPQIARKRQDRARHRIGAASRSPKARITEGPGSGKTSIGSAISSTWLAPPAGVPL